MIPTAFGVLASGVGYPDPAVYVGAAVGTGSGTVTFTLPVGTLAGDYCIIFTQATSNPANVSGGAGGWSYDTIVLSSNRVFAAHKQLVSGDLTSLSVTTAGAGQVIVYRGPTDATLRSSPVSGEADSTLVFPGFSKSADSMGLVAIGTESDSVDPEIPVPPGAWASRLTQSVVGGRVIADLLDVEQYVNGSTVTFTGFGTDLANGGFMYEFT